MSKLNYRRHFWARPPLWRALRVAAARASVAENRSISVSEIVRRACVEYLKARNIEVMR